jgi:tetratricopeptide (TPR) repeat protein
LRGRQFMAQTSPSLPQGVAAFERAVELDPDFAQAWAHLGRSRAALFSYGFDGRAFGASEAAIARALKLQPDLAEAQLARAYFLWTCRQAPFAEIERVLDEAARGRSNDADVLTLRSMFEFSRGRSDEGIALVRRAAELDPLNGAVVNQLGNFLRGRGQYTEAESAYRRAYDILGTSIPVTNRAQAYFQWKGDAALIQRTVDEVPGDVRSNGYWGNRSTLLYWVGDFAGALAAAEKQVMRERFDIRALRFAMIREAMGDDSAAQRDYEAALPPALTLREEFPQLARPLILLAVIYAGLGREAEATVTAQHAIEIAPAEDRVAAAGDLAMGSHAAAAIVHARFGRIDQALALVQANVAAGYWRRNYLLLCPDWARLRKDPRFRAIAENAPL